MCRYCENGWRINRVDSRSLFGDRDMLRGNDEQRDEQRDAGIAKMNTGQAGG